MTFITLSPCSSSYCSKNEVGVSPEVLTRSFPYTGDLCSLFPSSLDVLYVVDLVVRGVDVSSSKIVLNYSCEFLLVLYEKPSGH